MIEALICFALLPIGLFAWGLMIVLGVLVITDWTESYRRRK